jgi:hypothetical protein
MALQDLVLEKLRLIDESEAAFLKELSGVEADVLRTIRSTLDEMDREAGRLVLNARNRRLLVKLSTDLDKVLAQKMKAPIQEYLTTFDRLDSLNTEMFRELGIRSISPQISTVRLLTVDLISDKVTNFKNLGPEIAQPIKQILGKNLLTGATFRDAELELKTFIQTTVDVASLQGGTDLGHVNRWAKQITRDALSQYDGAVKQKIQEDLQMDSFRYVGTIKETTRSNCRHMLTLAPTVTEPQGSGKNRKLVQTPNRFSSLRQDDGGYRIADIPTIINLSQGGGGWIPGTTPENYFINRGGYNCRHEVIPYIYNSRKAQRALR